MALFNINMGRCAVMHILAARLRDPFAPDHPANPLETSRAAEAMCGFRTVQICTPGGRGVVFSTMFNRYKLRCVQQLTVASAALRLETSNAR
jgi:hypothetical protein